MMEGFIQPYFGDQFEKIHHKEQRGTYLGWIDIEIQREIPITQYSCNYCMPGAFVHTDRVSHNLIAHNSLHNPILTETVQALWGTDGN